MLDIIRIYLDEDNCIQISLNIYLLLIIIAIFMLLLAIRIIIKRRRFSIELNELEIGIGKNKVTLKPDYTDKQIAYKLWVEISTRKIGLEFEEDKDVIQEVYNSWYDFFGIARNIIKEIPVQKIKTDKEENLVQVSIKVLNLGLRPHLTQWQAKFRHWLSTTEEKFKNLPPQEIQKQYPDYIDLINNLKETNERLINYRGVLYEIAFGRTESQKG